MLTARRLRAARSPIAFALMACDLAAVVASFMLSFTLRQHAPVLPSLQHGPEVYLAAWPALLLWPVFFSREGLYPGLWLTVREELRRCVTGTTLASLVAVAGTFLTQTGMQFSRPIVVGGWLISLVLVPAARFLTRSLLAALGLTGPAAVMLGASKTASAVLQGFKRQRPPAIWPVALFDDDPQKLGQEVEGVPVVGPLAQASAWAAERGIRMAVVAMPGVPREKLITLVEEHSRAFQRILIVPDLLGLSGSETEPRDVQGILVLELRKNLLYPHNLIAKRALDIVLLVASLPLTLLAGALISLAIVADSGFPPVFGHPRIGKNGKVFTAWKFRTMLKGANEILRAALQADPDLRREWQETQKLRRDPRLTRVGRLLRRTSLDELPQLWNVLRGEMSLVGPRPIVHEEIARYGSAFDLYKQVPPGLTGLWQVSGRSNLSYADRVWLDTHYVRNWSIWLDLVILVRTVWVVICGVGAY